MRTRNVHLRAAVDGSQLRVSELNGISYVIAPCVSKLGDNVEHPINAPTPELIPASVLSFAAESRNNRPVVMGHPKRDGVYVSANSPDILAEYAYGHTFNATFAEGKISCELWLDPIRAKEVGPDAERVIERLQSGELVEVSEGDLVVTEEISGEYNGKRYGAVWKLCVSDHVATLPEGSIGACSVADGCGAGVLRSSLRVVNEDAAANLSLSALSQARIPTYTGTETSKWVKPVFADYIRYLSDSDPAPTSVSQCSAELKRKIVSHTLLGDPEATSFGDLSFFPVVNPANGNLNENALRGVLNSSADIGEKALISAKEIARRLLNSEFAANLEPKVAENGDTMSKPNLFKRLFSSISSLPQTLRDAMSNNELRSKLWEVLKDIEPGLYYVEDEDPDTGIVVYSTRVIYNEWEYKCEMFWWSRTYAVNADGKVTVNDDRTQVEPTMIYKPVSEQAAITTSESACGCGETISNGQTASGQTALEGENMTQKDAARNALIGRLIASKQSPFEESDRKALEGFGDEKLTAMVKQCERAEGDVEGNGKDKGTEEGSEGVGTDTGTGADTTSPAVTASAGQRVLTEKEYASLKAAADAHEAQQAARKSHLVASLKAAQTAFTEVDLNGMALPFLEKLALSHKVDEPVAADYSLRGVPKVSSEGQKHVPPRSWDLAVAARQKAN